MANQVTRSLGHVCRIYKNSAGKVIGTESVEVTVNLLQKKDYTFHRSVDKVNVHRKLHYLDVGLSRVV